MFAIHAHAPKVTISIDGDTNRSFDMFFVKNQIVSHFESHQPPHSRSIPKHGFPVHGNNTAGNTTTALKPYLSAMGITNRNVLASPPASKHCNRNTFLPWQNQKPVGDRLCLVAQNTLRRNATGWKRDFQYAIFVLEFAGPLVSKRGFDRQYASVFDRYAASTRSLLGMFKFSFNTKCGKDQKPMKIWPATQNMQRVEISIRNATRNAAGPGH